MNVERLQKLADHLRTIEPDRFDMKVWASPGFTESKCGTVACAWGHATTIFDEVELYLPCDGDNYGVKVKIDDEWRFNGFAIKLFFDITTFESTSIFYATTYLGNITPIDVANRIERFINAFIDG